LPLRGAVVYLDARGLPRALPPLSAPAADRREAAQVDALLVDRVRRRVGALLRTDDGGRGLPEVGYDRSARAARRSADSPLSHDRRDPAALRGPVGGTRGALLPGGSVRRGAQRAPRGRG